ncbi:MAG: HDOD domain-containing protein [Myxococcota bacterium]
MLAPRHHSLSDALAKINKLGVFPDAATRILEVTQNPAARLHDLERVVASDPVLSARILQVANSPLYGVSTKIGTLGRAVQMLGMDGTRGIAFALAVSTVGSMGGPKAQEVYYHAIACASVVHVAAPVAYGVHGGMLFVTALVHDLGLQLLMILEPESEAMLLDKFGHTSLLVKAERVHYGFDHAELVAHHHEPVAKKMRSRALLRVADDLSDAILDGETAEGIARLAAEHPLSAPLGIPEEKWFEVIERVPDVMSELTA